MAADFYCEKSASVKGQPAEDFNSTHITH